MSWPQSWGNLPSKSRVVLKNEEDVANKRKTCQSCYFKGDEEKAGRTFCHLINRTVIADPYGKNVHPKRCMYRRWYGEAKLLLERGISLALGTSDPSVITEELVRRYPDFKVVVEHTKVLNK